MTLVRKTRMAALIATHNLELAARMDRVVRLEGGAPRLTCRMTGRAPFGAPAVAATRYDALGLDPTISDAW